MNKSSNNNIEKQRSVGAQLNSIFMDVYREGGSISHASEREDIINIANYWQIENKIKVELSKLEGALNTKSEIIRKLGKDSAALRSKISAALKSVKEESKKGNWKKEQDIENLQGKLYNIYKYLLFIETKHRDLVMSSLDLTGAYYFDLVAKMKKGKTSGLNDYEKSLLPRIQFCIELENNIKNLENITNKFAPTNGNTNGTQKYKVSKTVIEKNKHGKEIKIYTEEPLIVTVQKTIFTKEQIDELKARDWKNNNNNQRQFSQNDSSNNANASSTFNASNLIESDAQRAEKVRQNRKKLEASKIPSNKVELGAKLTQGERDILPSVAAKTKSQVTAFSLVNNNGARAKLFDSGQKLNAGDENLLILRERINKLETDLLKLKNEQEECTKKIKNIQNLQNQILAQKAAQGENNASKDSKENDDAKRNYDAEIKKLQEALTKLYANSGTLEEQVKTLKAQELDSRDPFRLLHIDEIIDKNDTNQSGNKSADNKGGYESNASNNPTLPSTGIKSSSTHAALKEFKATSTELEELRTNATSIVNIKNVIAENGRNMLENGKGRESDNLTCKTLALKNKSINNNTIMNTPTENLLQKNVSEGNTRKSIRILFEEAAEETTKTRKVHSKQKEQIEALCNALTFDNDNNSILDVSNLNGHQRAESALSSTKIKINNTTQERVLEFKTTEVDPKVDPKEIS